MNLKDLHDKICTTLKREIPAIQTCEIYPSIRKELLAPALFVELVSLESGKDPGTEELALKARFEARIVIDKICCESRDKRKERRVGKIKVN